MWKFLGYALLFALTVTAAKPAQAQITGTGWTGTFYNDTSLTTAVASEVYPNGLYFNWAYSAPRKADNATPVPGVNADHFSARFTSTQTFAEGGKYVFTIYVDDGIRVFLDDVMVLNAFDENPNYTYRTFTFHRTIIAGETIDMRVEYVEFTANAVLVFQWGIDTITWPSTLELLAPKDDMQIRDISPTFIWHDVGAQSYVFKLWPVGGSMFVKATYPAAEICSSGACSLDSSIPSYPDHLALKTGHYTWRVTAKGAANKLKSEVASFTVEYPGKPLSLSPDFYTSITDSSPVLRWGEVAEADEYKVVLTRVKTGVKTKISWRPVSSFDCDGIWCALDLGTLKPPVTLKRGKYTWRVFVRNMVLKASVSKSNPAAFKVTSAARMPPLPMPENPDGFRAP